jgi:hypothetical protein
MQEIKSSRGRLGCFMPEGASKQMRANRRVGNITTTHYANSPSLTSKTRRYLVFHFSITRISGKYSAVVRCGVEEDNGTTKRHGKVPGAFMLVIPVQKQ